MTYSVVLTWQIFRGKATVCVWWAKEEVHSSGKTSTRHKHPPSSQQNGKMYYGVCITQWQTCRCCCGLCIKDGLERSVSSSSYGFLWHMRGVKADLLMREFITTDSYCWKQRLSQDTVADLMTLKTKSPGSLITLSFMKSVTCYIRVFSLGFVLWLR